MTIKIKHHAYNSELNRAVRNLGGFWDTASKEHVIKDTLAPEYAQELKWLWESGTVLVDIKALESISAEYSDVKMEFCGYRLAYSDRSLNVSNVNLLSGSMYTTEWDGDLVHIDAGTVLRIRISSHLLDKAKGQKKWAVTLASENKFKD